MDHHMIDSLVLLNARNERKRRNGQINKWFDPPVSFRRYRVLHRVKTMPPFATAGQSFLHELNQTSAGVERGAADLLLQYVISDIH